MLLDEVNEMQMLWIKGTVKSPQFSIAYERSRYLMASKACAQEELGSTTRKSKPTSFESDVSTIADLLLKGDIYPKETSEKRVFDDKFWWDLVRPRASKVGSEKARSREMVPEADHIRPLFELLSSTDANEYDEFELDESRDDDADVSVVSSTMISAGSTIHDLSVEDDLDSEDVVEEDWERLDEGERNATIDSTLKQLGNSTKKVVSPLILKDILGEDGDLALKNTAKSH